MTAQTIYSIAKESKMQAIVAKYTPVSFLAALTNLRPAIQTICYLGNNPLARKLMLFWGIVPFTSETRFNRCIKKLSRYALVVGSKEKKEWHFKVKAIRNR